MLVRNTQNYSKFSQPWAYFCLGAAFCVLHYLVSSCFVCVFTTFQCIFPNRQIIISQCGFISYQSRRCETQLQSVLEQLEAYVGMVSFSHTREDKPDEALQVIALRLLGETRCAFSRFEKYCKRWLRPHNDNTQLYHFWPTKNMHLWRIC